MRTALDGKIAAINGRLACLGLAWSLVGLVGWFVWFVLVSFARVRFGVRARFQLRVAGQCHWGAR